MGFVRTTLLGVAACVLTVGVPALLVPAPAGAEISAVSPTGQVKFYLRGNGHGRGMSQFGALGAAKQGLTYDKILSFYYANTTLVTLKPSTIRVRIAGAGTTASVLAESSLKAGTVGDLPTTVGTATVARYRLIADSSTTAATLTLQRLMSGKTTWTNVATGLPNGTSLTRGSGLTVRVYTSDGGSTRYYGSVREIRSGTTSYVVNYVGLDSYTRAVTPREVSPSWPAAAVSAQAVAARTYGRYAVEHPQSSHYDICDSSMCQVYGGYAHYDSSGTVVQRDDADSIKDNANQVLQYGGKAIFSQFGASNGGWSVDGGQPYLTAHTDPYDDAGGVDPYTLYSVTLSVPKLAKMVGLAQMTAIVVTKRDGHGSWGGRVLAGYYKGVDAVGKDKQVAFTGSDLASTIGAGTTYIGIHPIVSPA